MSLNLLLLPGIHRPHNVSWYYGRVVEGATVRTILIIVVRKGVSSNLTGTNPFCMLNLLHFSGATSLSQVFRMLKASGKAVR